MRPLSEYYPVLELVKQLFIRKSILTAQPELAEILKAHPRLIVVLNHATPLSWIPAICILAMQACESGHGNRSPRGIMDHFFYQIPFLKPIAEYLSQSDKPLNFDQLVEHFSNATDTDLVLFPEGSNCFFGSADQIQEFRSPKFIEIAVRTQTPILMAVHTGSESWAKAIDIKQLAPQVLLAAPDFLKKRIDSSGLISLPLIPHKIDCLRMHCEIFEPNIKIEDLSEDHQLRREQLASSANELRARMIAVLEDLKNEQNTNSPSESENI